MALFQKSLDTKIALDLKAAIATRDDIERRLSLAEARVVECRNTTHSLARDAAPDELLEDAEAALRAALDRVGSLSAASVNLKKDVADLEQAAAAIVDKKQRTATAAAIEQIALDLQEAGAAFDAGAAKLTAAARRAADVALDAHGLTAYAMNAASEVPAAVAMVAQVLRDRVAATLGGSAPAALPMPEQPAPKPKLIVPPPTKTIFALRHLKFTAEDGTVSCLGRMRQHSIPPHLAEKALKIGAAISETDPRVCDLQGRPDMVQPSEAQCESLDGIPSSDAAPIIRSAFEKPVVGLTITGTMPVRQPVATTRSPTGESSGAP